MNDFLERLVSVLQSGLSWEREGLQVEAEYVKDIVPDNTIPSRSKLKMVDTTKKYLVVKVHFPEKFKKETPDWREYACNPIVGDCARILYALGIASVLADAVIRREGYFTFWMEVNKKVYDRFPPVLKGQLPGTETMPQNVIADRD